MKKRFFLFLEALALSGLAYVGYTNMGGLVLIVGIVLGVLLGFFNKYFINKDGWTGFFQGIYILFRLSLFVLYIVFLASFSQIWIGNTLSASSTILSYFLLGGIFLPIGAAVMIFVSMLVPYSLGLAIGLYLKTKNQQNTIG